MWNLVSVLAVIIALSFPQPFATQTRAEPGWPGRQSSRTVRFSGEVNRGQAFEKRIAPGPLFRLNPERRAQNPPGWTIEIVPDPEPESGEHAEFIWVVNPPSHLGNSRYLDVSYGKTAQEVVAWNPREFSFVTNLADYRAAAKLVDALVYPQKPFAPGERESLLEQLDRIPKGEGTFTILDSRLSGGKEPGDRGAIGWLKFEVELTFPKDVLLDKKAPAQGEDKSLK